MMTLGHAPWNNDTLSRHARAAREERLRAAMDGPRIRQALGVEPSAGDTLNAQLGPQGQAFTSMFPAPAADLADFEVKVLGASTGRGTTVRLENGAAIHGVNTDPGPIRGLDTDPPRHWDMWAHEYDNGTFRHFGHRGFTELHDVKRQATQVRLTEHPEGDYYGWLAIGEATPKMVYPSRLQLSMCFVYGVDEAVARGRGDIVRMKCERLDIPGASINERFLESVVESPDASAAGAALICDAIQLSDPELEEGIVEDDPS